MRDGDNHFTAGYFSLHPMGQQRIKIGMRFSRLVVIIEVAPHIDPSGHKRRKWKCCCDCGSSIEVVGESLTRGNTKSCGCLRDEWARTGNAKRKHPLVLTIPRGVACVKWLGGLTTAGYGHRRNKTKKKNTYVHQEIWETVNGPIPSGLDVLHKCDNPACYNIDHLFLGTHADNMRDAAIKDRTAGKLSNADARYIREAVASGTPQHILAEQFFVSRAAVCSIVKGRNHKYA